MSAGDGLGKADGVGSQGAGGVSGQGPGEDRDAPRVSVVIPCYNGAAFLEAAVRSVIDNASGIPVEVVVIDDGSTDGSLGLARDLEVRHPGVVRVLRHPGGVNLGISSTRNLGISEARGDYVCFLDADDYWLPGRLDGAVRVLDQDPRIDGAFDYTLLVLEDPREAEGFPGGREQRIGAKAELGPGELFGAFLAGRVSWDVRGILVRRSAFARVGLFAEGLGYRQDTQLWYRMAAVLYLVPSPTPGPVAVYRRHGGNIYDPTLRVRDPQSVEEGDLEVWKTLETWMRQHPIPADTWDRFLAAYLGRLGRLRRWRLAWEVAVRHGRPHWILHALRRLLPGPRTLRNWWRGDRVSR